MKTITAPAELIQHLNFPPETAEKIEASCAEAARLYPMAVPEALLDRISAQTPNDPVLAQFLPRPEETVPSDGFSDNPLSETDGPILQKYAGRVLLLTGGKCAANCRFCFRRHRRSEPGIFLPNDSPEQDRKRLERLLAPIAADASIREIILSGSDPMGLSPNRLRLLLNYIKTLPFVNRVRVHTRRPILIPQETDSAFFDLWHPEAWPNQRIIFVFHINTPNEIGPETAEFLQKMAAVPVLCLSQTTLLAGVNDNVDLLAELFERLGTLGTMPYYLHQLDRVAGAAHFEVYPERGLALVRQLRSRLSGYLVPRYVREIPGQPCKIPMEEMVQE